ncbi:hypothetical protein XK27_06265 [Streptococcus suis]|nr:hypothetical protein A7J10_07450 [Streptococcus suis]KPA67116.1 hypothetical protein XK27_06265 [Streptococcus suis]
MIKNSLLNDKLLVHLFYSFHISKPYSTIINIHVKGFFDNKGEFRTKIRKNLVKQGISIVFDASCHLLAPELAWINRTQSP